MEQQSYLQIFRDRLIAVLLGIAVGLGVAAGVSASIPPTYTATATSFLSVQSDVGSLIERSQFALARISSYPELAVSSDVLTQTIDDLGLHESVQQLAKSVTATNPSTTVLLQVSATSRDPQTAADIANDVSSNLSDTVSQLENSTSDSRYTVTLDLRDRAQNPTTPSAPQRSIILGLGLVGGLALGLIAAIIWARLDTTIRSIKDVRRISGLPVIGELPSRGIPLLHSRSRRTAYLERTLRDTQLTIRQANGASVPRLLALVPASRAADDLTVRIGLARALAATGRTVALVESDFDGGIESILPSAAGATGLTEALAGKRRVKPSMQTPEKESFSILPAGRSAGLPAEYVSEQHAPAVVKTLVSTYDVTITQVTSVSRPASLELVGPLADGVVVVVRYGRTNTADLGHVLSRLRLLRVRPLGIVLTGVPVYRRSDLAADWRSDDFNEIPRQPVHAYDSLPEEEPETPPRAATKAPAKRPTRSRRKPAAAKAEQAETETPSAASDAGSDRASQEFAIENESDAELEIPELEHAETSGTWRG
jgi:capsular polysaccharide biosynthesis protein/Mrp family chromosome partitioning ATPase